MVWYAPNSQEHCSALICAVTFSMKTHGHAQYDTRNTQLVAAFVSCLTRATMYLSLATISRTAVATRLSSCTSCASCVRRYLCFSRQLVNRRCRKDKL